MASSLLSRLNVALQRFEQIISHYLGGGFPPGAICAVDPAYFDHRHTSLENPKPFDMKDGFLFAVPTRRRTIRKRLNRKFGWPQWVWKPFVPKTNILTCLTCGHFHLSDTLCQNCYNKVMGETVQLQKEIQNELGLNPVEKEVVVLYEGENAQNKYWKKQQIVEIPRKRPDWFSQNLMQTTTKKDSEPTTEKTIVGKIVES